MVIIVYRNQYQKTVTEERLMSCSAGDCVKNNGQGMFGTDIYILVRHVCTAEINRINVCLHAK